MNLKGYNNQNGMALVICLLIMTVVAMIGIGVMTDSTIEIKIATNHKNKATSFNYADLGCNISPKIIEDNIFEAGWGSGDPKWDAAAPNGGAYKFYEDPLIYVYENSFATLTDSSPTAIWFPDPNHPSDPGEHIVVVEVDKIGKLSTGSAIQMAAGYEGMGKGAAGGGYHAYFRCNSDGRVPENPTTTVVETYYRYVPK